MRISPFNKRFLRFGLFAIIAAVSYCLFPNPAETSERMVPAAERPPMFVLQVGIGKYLHAPTWATLRGSVNDVGEMRKVLESDRYNVPPANIVTLTDEQGTKVKIFESFQNHLIAKAREHFEKTKNRDAVVLFEFSGHGSQVPDVDGDEKDDHLDETLVTYDSEDAPGKNYDITDDEIFALTSELRRYTDNIVYIFDSCHSGSGTRDAADVRRLPERKTVPVSVMGVGAATRSGTSKPEDDPASGVLPPGDDYIVITAARSGQLASQRNCFEECGQTKTPVVFGNLTFYLVDELKQARSDTSYRELMENVVRRVTSEKPTQTPQIEGDKSRFVFAALGSSEDSFTKIAAAETKSSGGSRIVKIRTGAMQGVTPKTIVSFYDKSATRFDKAEKISSGSVIAVSPGEATVQLIDPKREIGVDDKAVVIAPDLGSLRLKVNLDLDSQKLSAFEKDLMTSLRARFTPKGPETVEKRGIDIITGQAAAGRWDIAVLKDSFSKVAGKVDGGLTGCEAVGQTEPVPVATAADAEVFYLAGRDFVPMFGFCLQSKMDPNSQNGAAKRLEEAIVHIARLKSIGAIANRRSPLFSKITVRPIRLGAPFGCTDSKFTAGGRERMSPNPATGYYSFKPGDVFWFEVTNNSPHDLYLTLLDMAPNGSVKVFSPRARADENDGVIVSKNGGTRILMSDECRVDAAGNFIPGTVGAFRISKVLGLDRFKIIASVDRTTRDDFAYLEMSALTARSGESTLAGKSDWTAIETILQINDTSR